MYKGPLINGKCAKCELDPDDCKCWAKPDGPAREWWIDERPDVNWDAAFRKKWGSLKFINVIEKSAYDALAKELAEAKAQLQFTNSSWPHEKKLHDQLASAQARIAELEIRVGDNESFLASDDCYYWTPEAAEKHKQELTAAKAENIGNLQLIGDLQVEINRLMDTPGGKRIYGALNEITRLNAEIERLAGVINTKIAVELMQAEQLTQANARLKELSEEIAKMASDSHYVRNSGKRIKELEVESDANFKSAESWKEQALEKFELIDAIEDAKEREQKLVAAILAIEWLQKCECDEAYTKRGLHEPNAIHKELDDLIALAKAHRGEGV